MGGCAFLRPDCARWGRARGPSRDARVLSTALCSLASEWAAAGGLGSVELVCVCVSVSACGCGCWQPRAPGQRVSGFLYAAEVAFGRAASSNGSGSVMPGDVLFGFGLHGCVWVSFGFGGPS